MIPSLQWKAQLHERHHIKGRSSALDHGTGKKACKHAHMCAKTSFGIDGGSLLILLMTACVRDYLYITYRHEAMFSAFPI